MDLMRHLSVFDPAKFHGRIAVIGVGALGSAVALNLAKLGIPEIMIFDPDRVEPHNLPNQVLYGPADVGKTKVEAAAMTLSMLTGVNVKAYCGFLTSRMQLRRVNATHVFVCVDSMEARKKVFDATLYNPFVDFFCEGRMSSTSGTSSAFNPKHMEKSKEYAARLYPDEEVVLDRGACGNVLMLGATAMMLACQMTWQFINHANGAEYAEEISADYRKMEVQSRGNLV